MALQQEQVCDPLSRGISRRQEQVHLGAKGGVLLPSAPRTYDHYCKAVGSSGPSTLKKKKKKSEKLAPKPGTNSNELSQGLSPCLRVCLINCGADEQALKQQRSSLMIPSTEFQLSPGVTSRIPNPAENTS